MDWMDANQLGRRNLPPDAFKMSLGRRYNRTKKAHGQRGPEKLGQIDPAFLSTAANLAAEHLISENTVKRAGKFAEEVAKDHARDRDRDREGRHSPGRLLLERKREILAGRIYNRTKKAQGQRGPEKLGQIDPAFLSTAAKLAAEHSVSENTVQLGRRNLPPDAFKMSLGRRYNRTKQAHGGHLPKGKGQIELFLSTAAKLAAEHSVSENTVKRAGVSHDTVAKVKKLEAKAKNQKVKLTL